MSLTFGNEYIYLLRTYDSGESPSSKISEEVGAVAQFQRNQIGLVNLAAQSNRFRAKFVCVNISVAYVVKSFTVKLQHWC